MTEDEIRKLAEVYYNELFLKDPTLVTCDKCGSSNCMYNLSCHHCDAPILEVYRSIVKILQSNGFEQQMYGDMIRANTGCIFSFECLSNYKSVLDFQLEWGYADIYHFRSIENLNNKQYLCLL